MNRLSSIVLVAFVTGCSPTLSLTSPAPPSRVVSVDRERDHIEISQGIAVAVDCWRVGGPCKELRAVSASPEVASVFPAHEASVSSGYMNDGSTSSLALVGMKPGRTTLHVWSQGYSTDYVVTVLPVDHPTKAAR